MLDNEPLRRLDDLVLRHRGELIAIARGEGLRPEEALECVQDALCTFLTRKQQGQASPAEFTLPSLRITVRNAARNTRRLHAHAKPHDPVDARPELACVGCAADQQLEQAETLTRLHSCVAGLCGVQRAVVMLRLLEERSGEDVAQSLGLSRGHVDVLVHRAKAALRTCMRAAE